MKQTSHQNVTKPFEQRGSNRQATMLLARPIQLLCHYLRWWWSWLGLARLLNWASLSDCGLSKPRFTSVPLENSSVSSMPDVPYILLRCGGQSGLLLGLSSLQNPHHICDTIFRWLVNSIHMVMSWKTKQKKKASQEWWWNLQQNMTPSVRSFTALGLTQRPSPWKASICYSAIYWPFACTVTWEHPSTKPFPLHCIWPL